MVSEHILKDFISITIMKDDDLKTSGFIYNTIKIKVLCPAGVSKTFSLAH